MFDVPPGYFRAVDAPLVRGREFVASDTAPALTVTPAIISESLAVALFKSVDPIGQRLLRVSPYETRSDARPTVLEIVGIVRVTREAFFLESEPDLPPVFVPFRQRELYCRREVCIAGTKLLIRTIGPAEPLIPTVRAVVRDAAPSIPVTRMRTLAQGDRWYRQTRLDVAGIAAVCGVITLMLASVGLYATVGIAVGQRRREIGLRVALGAQARQVVRLFFTSGLRVTLLGLALGLPVSIVAAMMLLRMLGVSRDNMPVLAALVTLVVVAVASLASWLPARRAAAVDPMVALRSD